MADNSKIEWTDATWNPVRGCSRVSPGCGGANHQGGCYAETIAARFSGPGLPFEGFAERTKHGGRWTGKLALVDDMMTVPLRWRKSRRIFVNSMSDLFHETLPDEAIDKVFAVMALAPQHTFQVLTKRADRMRAYLSAADVATRIWQAAGEIGDDCGRLYLTVIGAAGGDWGGATPWPLRHVWLGVSVEDQPRADERIPALLATPAAVRFLSCEPLLGPLDLTAIPRTKAEGFMRPLDGLFRTLDWVIVGGESGRTARPSHPDWFRALRDQCAAAEVPFFFKQWGEWALAARSFAVGRLDHKFEAIHDGVVRTVWMERVGKKAAGAILDGREHREFPTWQSSP